MITTVSHHDWLIKDLAAHPEAALALLNAEAEDGELKYLLGTLRDVVEAQGGIGALAKKTKLSRTTLYKTLSENGNPEVSTLDTILRVYGIRIAFLPVAKQKAASKEYAGMVRDAPARRRKKK